MARGETLAEQEVTITETSVLRAVLRGTPVGKFRQLFRNNIHRATRIAKRQMVETIKDRLHKGVKGADYTTDYAEVKNELPFTPGRTYTGGGPVDLNFTGQLLSALEGRGRARPSRNQINIWLGFRRNARRPAPRRLGAAPSGGDITNRQLAEILNGEQGPPNKWKIGTEGPPLTLHADERDVVIRRTANELTRNTS